MITHLKYGIIFESTGKSFQRSLKFEEGLTAVEGPNESGKSVVLEMIRYALFGTPALRAPLKEYRHIETELQFQVQDIPYTVKRSKGKATFLTSSTIVATGTDPVNKAVHERLGFGLSVFDTVLASLQDQSQKLTDMSPAQRKQMVDSLTGLIGVQEVITECRRRSRSAKDMVAGLREGYIAPVEPEEPHDYRGSTFVKDDLTEVNRLRARIAECKRILSVTVQHPGDEPPFPGNLEELRVEAYAQDELEERIRKQKAHIAQNPSPSRTKGELETQVRRLHWEKLDRAHPAPRLSRDETEEQIIAWGRCKEAQRKLDLQTRIDSAQNDGDATCPACGEGFFVQHRLIEQLCEELENLDHVDTEEDFSDLIELATLYDYLDKWDKREAVSELASVIPPPTMTRAEVDHQFKLHAFDHEGAAFELIQMVEQRDEDARPAYHEAVEQIAKHKIWEEHLERYRAWEQESTQTTAQLARHEDDLARMGHEGDDLERELEEAIAYEALLDSYEEQKERADQVLERIEREAQKQEDWKTAAEVVAQFSMEVKSYLLPSLAYVASSLMSIITGGRRQVVTISRDFEISVDGQPVSTLSGSAKVAVNLALRVGLGQVLTSSTFPVFLADEVDASMDDERAASTVECIRNLTKTMKQVVLVSHKPVVSADHYITMESQ